MARVHGRAHAFWKNEDSQKGDHPKWKLIFNQGWERYLRIGGYFAGHPTLEMLKDDVMKQDEEARKRLDDAKEVKKMRVYVDEAEDSSSWKAAPPLRTNQDHRAEVPCEHEDPVNYAARKRSHQAGKLPMREDASRGLGRETESSSKKDKNPPSLPSRRERPQTARMSVPIVEDFELKAESRLVPITHLPVCIDGVVMNGNASGDSAIHLTGKFYGKEVLTVELEMWSIQFGAQRPAFLVRATTGSWFKLLYPKPSYFHIVSGDYHLLHFLDFAKKNPQASELDAESHLVKNCGSNSNASQNRRIMIQHMPQYVRVVKCFADEEDGLKETRMVHKVFPTLFTKVPEELEAQGALHSCIQSRVILDSVLGRNDDETNEEEDEEDASWDTSSVSAAEASARPVSPQEKAEDARQMLLCLNEEHSKRGEEGKKRRRPVKFDDKHHEHQKIEKKAQVGTKSLLKIRCKDLPKDQRKKADMKTNLKMDDPPICHICDDGGELLICDGPCARYFHGVSGSGQESFCETLSLTRKDTKAERWYCQNCVYKQHQCFICNELGSTDEELGQPEVFQCEIPSCKRFYHAHCVAELVDFPNWRVKASAIRNGTERLICPRHKCDTCRRNDMTPGKLVQCRRCPKAWHKECFTNYNLSGELRTTPIWNHQGQDFVYCKQHKINPDLMTPNRDHIHFPEPREINPCKRFRLTDSGAQGGAIVERQYRETPPPIPLAAEIGLVNM